MPIALLAAIVAGALIALQSALVGLLGARVHPFVAATWIHGAGLVFGIVAILLLGRLDFETAVVRESPWLLLAGVAGMLLVTGIAVAVAGLGLASTIAVVTGVQLLTGFALEASPLAETVTATFDPLRFVGAAMIVAGAYLVVSRGGAHI